jgi:hypothetical protein
MIDEFCLKVRPLRWACCGLGGSWACGPDPGAYLHPRTTVQPGNTPALHTQHLDATQLERLSHALHALVSWSPFDTTFYLCCLSQPPPVDPDNAEVMDSQWLSLSEATESFMPKKICLAPPPFRPVLWSKKTWKLCLSLCFAQILFGSCIRRAWKVATHHTNHWGLYTPALSRRWAVHRRLTYIENLMSTDKKTEEMMKEGKNFHRRVIHNNHLYSIQVTVQSINTFIPRATQQAGATCRVLLAQMLATCRSTE